jgi:hypothetical protein
MHVNEKRIALSSLKCGKTAERRPRENFWRQSIAEAAP